MAKTKTHSVFAYVRRSAWHKIRPCDHLNLHVPCARAMQADSQMKYEQTEDGLPVDNAYCQSDDCIYSDKE